jgi:hypothetical protein
MTPLKILRQFTMVAPFMDLKYSLTTLKTSGLEYFVELIRIPTP